jgi:hypothetical protein
MPRPIAAFEGSVDTFIDMAKASLAMYAKTQHFTGNQLFEVNGAAAWAEHDGFATHRIAADERGPQRDFVTAIR